MNPQIGPFKKALAKVKQAMGSDQIAFEVITAKDLRESSFSIDDLVNWLLGGHIHFIICHVHQGVANSDWSVVELYSKLNSLRTHEGFPNGNQLNCPVYTQDKRGYLDILQNVTLPSYFISVPTTKDDATTLATISR